MNHTNTVPLISVIIPVYNGEKTLMNTLSSVLQQTYTHFEVIIVDDASEQPVESYLNQITDNRVQIYRTERSNANVARNYGISKSKGDYIAMLDADDYWLENHLQDCLDILMDTRAEGLYGSLFLSRDIHRPDQIDKKQIMYARKLKDDESMIDYLLKTGFGAQTSTIFTTARSSKDILWDPELIDHQDYDFVVRFYNKYRMEIKKEPSVIYFLSSGRSLHFETCITFVERNMKDVSPLVYNRYNLNMYMKASGNSTPRKIISYFKEESTRYMEYMSYKQYMLIRNPQTRWQRIKDKWAYLLYIIRLKTG